MLVSSGDRVLVVDAETLDLQPFVGAIGEVKSVIYSFHPASATVIIPPNNEIRIYVRYLEVIPPDTSPFQHDQWVKVKKPFSGSAYMHKCVKDLINKIGQVKGFDKRADFYLIKCADGTKGWFPATSLVPVDYKGARFYYPLERVLYKGEEKTVSQAQMSNSSYGQILKIDGEWVPSSDVTPTP